MFPSSTNCKETVMVGAMKPVRKRPYYPSAGLSQLWGTISGESVMESSGNR
jgi:hypothetical protein